MMVAYAIFNDGVGPASSSINSVLKASDRAIDPGPQPTPDTFI